MYIRDVFDIGGVAGSTDGHSDFLDWHNCKISNKSLANNGSYLYLHLIRESDGAEGRSSLKLKHDFADRKDVINKIFVSEKIMGLTLNQLGDIKTEDLDINL